MKFMFFHYGNRGIEDKNFFLVAKAVITYCGHFITLLLIDAVPPEILSLKNRRYALTFLCVFIIIYAVMTIKQRWDNYSYISIFDKKFYVAELYFSSLGTQFLWISKMVYISYSMPNGLIVLNSKMSWRERTKQKKRRRYREYDENGLTIHSNESEVDFEIIRNTIRKF